MVAVTVDAFAAAQRRVVDAGLSDLAATIEAKPGMTRRETLDAAMNVVTAYGDRASDLAVAWYENQRSTAGLDDRFKAFTSDGFLPENVRVRLVLAYDMAEPIWRGLRAVVDEAIAEFWTRTILRNAQRETVT